MFKKSFEPSIDHESRILILGSLPGEASLHQQEYYAYRHNSFWRIMGDIFGFDGTLAYNDRMKKLLAAKVALWDVVGSGRREGSLDSNITDVVPNDVAGLLEEFPGIECICCNGGTSFRLLKRHFPELFGRGVRVYQLPSTSPAAARLTYQGKLAAYRDVIRSVSGMVE